MNLKQEYELQIERYYSELKRTRYYTLNQIMEIVGVSKRTVFNKLRDVKIRFSNVPSKMYLENDQWYIERSVVYLFLPKYKPRVKTVYNQDWLSFITWITRDNFDKDYHCQLISEVQCSFPEGRFLWVIEKTDNGVNHVHLVSDLPSEEIRETINNVLLRYIPQDEYRLEVEPIRNVINVIDYMLKQRNL